MTDNNIPADVTRYTARHLRFGWWSLLSFLSLGIMLETLHGLKVPWYLDPGFEVRRLVWTLAHAHGTLFGLIHIAFALTVHVAGTPNARWMRFASPCLMSASVLLPGGFFLGGVFIYDGDPGLGIFLVPVGAGFLLLAVLVTGWGMLSFGDPPEEKQQPEAN